MASGNGCGVCSKQQKRDLATWIRSNGKTVNEEVLKLHAEKGLLDCPDAEGRTPLMVACLTGYEDIVKFLLENGANPNSKSLKEGNTPLHYACMEENESNYDKDSRVRMTRKVSIVKLLLSHRMLQNGLDVTNNDGQTPLMFACLADLEDVVKFLLANGANPKLKSLKEGNSFMHYACMEDNEALYGEYSQERMIRKLTIVTLLLSQMKLQNYVDDSNKDGQTPLMFACLAGFEDVIKFLLENGVNPNSKTLTEAATPLHYACTVMTREDKIGEMFSYYERSDFATSRIPIVKLLMSYGAIAVENIHGWSPSCVAAFHLQDDVVEYFMLTDDGSMSWEEKIKVAELIGVSNTLMLQKTEFKESHRLLSRAIFIQQVSGLPKAEPVTSELEIRFSKFWKECQTAEELESIKKSEFSLKAHAFLIGERLYPQSLKKRYLYPLLLHFADELYSNILWDEFYQVMSCALGFELQNQLEIGSVANKLDCHCYGFQYADEEPNYLFLQHLRNLLWEYVSVFQHVRIDSLSPKVDAILKSFGCILWSEAFYCLTGDSLQSTVLVIEKLVRIIRGRIRRENPSKFQEMYSVVYELTSLLYQSFDHFKKYHEGMDANSLTRLRFVILKMLFSENACHTDRVGYLHVRGDTLLHLMAKCALLAERSVFQDREELEELARAFIRHGSPIDAVNVKGETAKDVYEDGDPPDEDTVFWSILRPPTTILTLQESAIRAVFRYDLIYQEALPPCLCEMIESEYHKLLL